MTAMFSRRGALAMAAAAPLALGGCGAVDAPGTIRFWAMGNEAAHVPKLLSGFTAAHPGIDVRLQALPWTAAHEKLLTGFAGGSLPDVAQIGNTWLAELAAIGAIRPLAGDAAPLVADQFPAVLDTNRIDGRLMAVPWYVDARLQFYRTDLLAKAGYAALPQDWAGWKAALHRLKRASGEGNYAILLPVNEFEQLLTFALQQPEPLLRDDGTRGNFRSDGFRAALAFYKSLFDEGLAPLASSTQISNVWNEFQRGFFSVYLSGPWTVGDLKSRLGPDFEGKWATAAMPGPSGPGAAAPGGSSLVVFSTARDPQAAGALVRYLSDPVVQARFNAISGDLPARPSAWAAAGLSGDRLMAPFGEQLGRARAVPKVPEWERIVSEMQIVAEQAVRGKMTVDAAATEIDARADRLLEKRRWMVEKGRAA
ncbi:sugar ABC transporter substrate-binding protein [Sphingomonas sp.]|uniref:sugar ABC transporter substrate-binding protein n=1 Tax=Sphingomonas sp. TaxID=28214 RepID=UPI002DD68A10|nr:sugar ABC transporter substrate-binding protein [Sphingomonas sp.]